MIIIYTSVHHGHNHVRSARGVVLPDSLHIHVAACYHSGLGAVVDVVPLLTELRVVKGQCRYRRGCGERHWILKRRTVVNESGLERELCGLDL